MQTARAAEHIVRPSAFPDGVVIHTAAQLAGDRELITRLLRADPTAPEAFVQRFGRLIYATLRHCGIAPDDIDDLYQTAFLHLWSDQYRPLRQWRCDSKLSSYISVIVTRIAYKQLRQRSPASFSLGTVVPHGPLLSDSVEDRIDPTPGPEAQTLHNELRRALNVARAHLSPRDATIIRLKHDEGLTYKEIAATLEITVSNVGVALARAEARLRYWIVEEHPEILEPDYPGFAIRPSQSKCGHSLQNQKGKECNI